MHPREHLHPGGLRAVPGDRAQLVTIGADHVNQRVRIPGVALACGIGMPLPIPCHLPRRAPLWAHNPEHLGYAGRRCLVSRKWSGKNLTEHRTDRRDHVLRTLGAVGITPRQATEDCPGDRYVWTPIRPTDPDQPDRVELLMRSISERRRWREQYERARAQLPATGDAA